MECKFQIGQKVVAIKNEWILRGPALDMNPEHPKKGDIYTISNMHLVDDKIYLELKELSPLSIFYYRGFRPLQERPQQTDISVFRQMLKTRTLEDA